MKGMPLSVSLLKSPVHLLALGFGAGLSPKAPGTVGTLVGVAGYAFIEPLGWRAHGLIVLLAALAGIWICGESARRLGVHDHGGIVWDEIVGYWLTMWLAPPGWSWMLAGFVLFRFFDIVKPWPIRVLDRRVHGGFGIMVDDLVAGVFAALCLQLLRVVWV